MKLVIPVVPNAARATRPEPLTPASFADTNSVKPVVFKSPVRPIPQATRRNMFQSSFLKSLAVRSASFFSRSAGRINAAMTPTMATQYMLSQEAIPSGSFTMLGSTHKTSRMGRESGS